MALHTELDVCTEYQQLGLAATVEKGRILLRTGIAVTAVKLPAATGQRAMSELRARLIRGPIMACPRPRPLGERWTILCIPDRWPHQEEKDALHRANATICVSGTALRLPDTRSGHGRPWWVTTPGHRLPTLSTVLTVVNMVAPERRASAAKRWAAK